MVERKLKGVLVVLSIFILVMFSGFVSAACEGTPNCDGLPPIFVMCGQNYQGCEIDGSSCVLKSGWGPDCEDISLDVNCIEVPGCSVAAAPSECSSGNCCSGGMFDPAIMPCASTDRHRVCSGGDSYDSVDYIYCTGNSASCPPSPWVYNVLELVDDCSASETCINNYCVSCTHDCSTGATGCSSDGESIRTCGYYDEDPCRDWSSYSSCGGTVWTGSSSCSGGDVWQDRTNNDCEYLGFYTCTSSTTSIRRDDCLTCEVCAVGDTTCNWVGSGNYQECYADDVWNFRICDNVRQGVFDNCNDITEDCITDQCVPKTGYTCGDDIIVPAVGEECDNNNLDGENCGTRGYDGGTLDCYDPGHPNECTFDTSSCTTCGNNNQEGAEVCDGNSIACTSLGRDGGTATCTSNCLGWVTSSCCDDTCSTLGARERVDSDTYRLCGDYDSDVCDEWQNFDCGGGTPYTDGSGNCVACTDASQCSSGDACQYATCNSGSCGLGTYSDCCINDGDCSASSGCYNAYCDGSNNCQESFACDADEGCVSGSCSTCSINSVSWDSSSYDEGETATISIGTNSACNGKLVELRVRRDQLVDTTLTTLSSVTISGGSASRNWVTNINAADDYYIRADLAVNNNIDRDSSNVYIDIPVIPQCGINGCQAGEGENCATCEADCGCTGGDECQGSVCVAPCTIDSAWWSTTSATNNDWVDLNVGTSNCNGEAVSFIVMERDFGTDDNVAQNPNSDTVSSGSAQSSWQAVAPDLGGESTPEYYFTAYVGSDSMESTNELDVSVLVTCPDGDIDSGETCDDGDSNNGDGCSSSCQIEWGYECSGEPSNCWLSCGDGGIDAGEDCDGSNLNGQNCISQGFDGGNLDCDMTGGDACTFDTDNCFVDTCGDGNLDSGNGETCDDGNTNNGEGCSSSCQIEFGWECDNSPMPSNCWLSCGDGTDDGEECDDGNVQPDDGCSATCTVESGYVCNGWPSVCDPPIECSISNVYWTEITVEEGNLAHINIETANCNDGETISIIIRESDNFGSDDDVTNNPANVQTTANSASASWVAEYQEDTEPFEENPPEYYIEARVISTDHAAQSILLEVTEMNICFVLTGCDSYLNQLECEADDCAIAESTIPDCGFEYDPETRCYFANDCSCKWDTVQGICESFKDDGLDCGGCGNGILDFGTEQCDDGNRVSGDGCSQDCELEILSPPCAEGTTLCFDGTCSLNCWFTDAGSSECNYDGTCDIGVEGCTCSDCDGELDSCEAGLLCNINDAACCDSVSDDGICHPYCAYIDPDCAGNDYCGNGFRGFGEECDDGNNLNDDGCSNICEYEIFGPGVDCIEGTMLCNDGTCSLNCDATDDGHDPSCQDGSCCEAGLNYNVQDNACCNAVTDGYCHPYCALSDPDCNPGQFGGIDAFGSCSYTKNSDDDCSDGILRRDYSATWTWDETNQFYEDPLSEDYTEDPIGVWHYDLMDLTGVRRSERCTSISDELICPAQIQLPAFGKTQLILSIIVLAIAYTIVVFRRRD